MVERLITIYVWRLRYVTLGRVPRSSSSLLPRDDLESRHLALGIFEITEHERFRRARLHAGRLNVAVPELALLSFCLNRHRLDALHAERALLHHADRAQRDVGVELQMQRLVP